MSDSIPSHLTELYEKVYKTSHANGFESEVTGRGSYPRLNEASEVEFIDVIIRHIFFNWDVFIPLGDLRYNDRWVEEKLDPFLKKNFTRILAVKELMDKYSLGYNGVVVRPGFWFFRGVKIHLTDKPLSAAIAELEEAILAYLIATSSS
jgi:hypothetical protein